MKTPSTVLEHVVLIMQINSYPDILVIIACKHRYPKVCNYSKEAMAERKISRNEKILMIDNPNGVRAFNGFQEKGCIEKYKCNFRVFDLTIDDLYDIGVPSIEK